LIQADGLPERLGKLIKILAAGKAAREFLHLPPENTVLLVDLGR
jgi:hypothetical protein